MHNEGGTCRNIFVEQRNTSLPRDMDLSCTHSLDFIPELYLTLRVNLISTGQYTTIPRRGGEKWWRYTETRSVEVYIHCSSSTLSGQLFQYLQNQMDKRNASSISSSETFAKRRVIFLSVRKTVKSIDIPTYGSQSKRAKIAIH